MRLQLIKPFGRGIVADRLRVSFCDRDGSVVDALAASFHDVAGVEVLRGNLLDLDCDALVSPSNSFGDMGGGIDRAIDIHYGESAQPRLVAAISERFCGELPVGMAIVLSMDTPRFPFLVAAPTMRVPCRVDATINAYLSMRATMVAIELHCRDSPGTIRSVAIPGLCTGVDAMEPRVAAQQMRTAYDMIVEEGWRRLPHPAFAPFALDDPTR